MSTTYIDPHTEKTFSWNGKEYYISQLYGKPMTILSPVIFFPIGSQANNFTPLKSASGKTEIVQSSTTVNGKPVVLFNIPGMNPSGIQYYAFLDTTKLIPSTVLTPKSQQDIHEKNVDSAIKTGIEVSNMDFFDRALYSLLPGNSYLWMKKNGKWVLPVGLGLLLFGKPLARAIRRKVKR